MQQLRPWRAGLRGKILVDITNPFTGGHVDFVGPWATGGSTDLAAAFPGALLVGAFKNVWWETFTGAPDPSVPTIHVISDAPEAKRAFLALCAPTPTPTPTRAAWTRPAGWNGWRCGGGFGRSAGGLTGGIRPSGDWSTVGLTERTSHAVSRFGVALGERQRRSVSCPAGNEPPHMSLMSLGVLHSSRKENEFRLPLHPRHLERIDADLRERIFLEEGYGERFGIGDDALRPLVAGLRSRERLVAECDVMLLPKPMHADLAELREGQVLWGWPHCVQDEKTTRSSASTAG